MDVYEVIVFSSIRVFDTQISQLFRLGIFGHQIIWLVETSWPLSPPSPFRAVICPPSLWILTVTPSTKRHVSDLFNCYTRQLFVANYSTPICVTADVSYRQTRAWFLPPHLVDTCICSRSFPLPVSFCAASQCLQSPCTSNAKTQSLCKTHTSCSALYV